MMSVAPVASASGAADYYSSKDNYYFLGNLESAWLGKGAQELGLEGPVDLDAFTDILHGKLPNGVELGKDVQGSHVHRPGHDLTFSAPKSVSLLILAGNDRELLAAHNEAVKEAAAHVEQLISARVTRDGVTQIVPTGKLVAAAFTHDTTRNLDPGVHTHLIVANVTESEGKHRALATDFIHNAGFIETVYRHQVTLGQIYRDSLKRRVEARGFETEVVGKHDMWEIKGMPAEVLAEFSTRSREIRDAVGDEASLRSRDKAALDTRQAKRAPQYYEPERPLRPAREEPAPQHEREEVNARALQEEEKSAPAEDKTQAAARGEDVKQTPAGERGKDAGAEGDERQTGERRPESGQRTGPENADGQDAGTTRMTDAERAAAGREQLRERWRQQMAALNFDLEAFQASVEPPEAVVHTPREAADASRAVRDAVSTLSDGQTRFTYGDLLMTAHGAGRGVQNIGALREAIDAAIKSDLLIPLDADKGVFTSQIHLLDELSVQALAVDVLKEGKVANFAVRGEDGPARLAAVKAAPLAILNAPSSVPRVREMVEEVVTMSLDNGREVRVIAGSAERGDTLSRSALLKERLSPRAHILSGQLALRPHSTLVVEGAERLGMKEVLVLTGEAREKNVQLLFMDSAGRQANGSALTALESAKVPRLSMNEPAPGLEARVVSVADKRDRYHALAGRFAELSRPGERVTAVVVGEREQKRLTEVIRSALQDAGRLERGGVTVEARAPVYTDAKTRRLPGTYRAGMVLEDRSSPRETRHFTVDRVHESTRMLSLIDSDGVLSRMRLADVTGNWRLFTREALNVAAGEKLFVTAADKETGMKARERLDVSAAADGKITFTREGGRKSATVSAERPLYVAHGWVSAPGARDNERGTVLAALNARELNGNTLNALAQSGDRAEVFTGEAQQQAEAKLGRMRQGVTPLQLVRRASGQDGPGEGVAALSAAVMSEAKRAVNRTVAEMTAVTVPALKLAAGAARFLEDGPAIRAEIHRQVKAGELIELPVRGEMHYVPLATWELEKTLVREVERGKDAVAPLMAEVPGAVLEGLTAGQKQSTRLVLETADRFTLVQGYAGVGKTTQFGAVKAALETLPAHQQPVVIGLAPTHRAVKEMREVGIEAQTIKSFVLDWQQRTSAGERVSYENALILIDESSMAGLHDTAAAYQAIAAGNGRAVSVGDTDQLKSPEGGAPFKLLQERSPADVAIMKEIVRQRSADVKAAVYDTIGNRTEAALRHIDRVSPSVVPREAEAAVPEKSVAEAEAPVDAIVADWISRTPDARARTMIITQLNADRHAINAGIHGALAERGELGEKSVHVPVLERVSGGRHAFNRVEAWEPGQVVKKNDRYLSVTGVDAASGRVILRDENERTRWYSPAELNAGSVEVFRKMSIRVREGESLRFDRTQRDAGHLANETYRVEKMEPDGRLTLKNDRETKVIEPGRNLADRHVDYAYAVTGYGAQGASSDMVIALEGTKDFRGLLSGKRAFYINVSRAKEHVQIYTDGLKDWKETLTRRDTAPETVHDALDPQTERAQARAVWSMGLAVKKTAIGRAWMKSEGLTASGARVIPATKKYPDPHLALPVFDGNGKSAGLAMLPLKSDMGYILTGAVRLLAGARAQGAILQRSRSGETLVAGSLREGLDMARANPQAGVVWQTGEEPVSRQLLRVSGERHDPARAQEEEARREEAAGKDAKELAAKTAARDEPAETIVRESESPARENGEKAADEEKLAQRVSAALVPEERAVRDEVRAPDTAERTVKENVTARDLAAREQAQEKADITPEREERMKEMTEHAHGRHVQKER